MDAALVVAAATAMLALTHAGPGLANDTSRLATAEALVEHGQFAIDETHFEYTVDKIKVDGQFYSDKPPSLSLYLAGVYYLARGLFGWTMDGNLSSLYYLLSLCSSGLAFLATLLGVRRLAAELGANETIGGLVALSGCFGTLLLPYSVVISSHAVAAPFLVWFALLVVRHGFPEESGEIRSESSAGGAIRAGVAGGLAAVIEPLASAFVAPLAVASFASREGWWSTAGLAIGGLAAVVPHSLITYEIAGNPILANLNPAYFDYAGSMHRAENLSGVGWAHDSVGAFFRYAYHSLAGYRGWVMYNMPAAVGVGWACWWGVRGERRWFAGALLVGTLLFFVLTIGWSSNYSGFAYGIRWHATSAPLLAALLAVPLAAVERNIRRFGWISLGVATLFGVASAAPGTVDPWTPSLGDEYSIVEVFSSRKPYVKKHLEAATAHFEEGRPYEAQFQAEHAMRRDSSSPVAWEVAIRAAKRLDDESKLRAYRRRLTAEEGPPGADVRANLIGIIEEALESNRSR